MIEEYVKYSLKHIRRRKLRAWLTIIGIIIGIASIVALISLGQGLENAIRDQFEKMGANGIRIIPGGFTGPPAGERGLSVRDAEFVESVKEIDYVNAILFQFTDVEYDNEEVFIALHAYDSDIAERFLTDIDTLPHEGRVFKKGEKDSVVIGYELAHDTFDKEIRLRNKIKIKDKEFRVVGILEKTGIEIDDMVIIPLETGRIIFDKPDLVNVIIAMVRPGFDMEVVAEKIEKKLEKRHDKKDFTVLTPSQILSQLGTILGVVQAVLAGIAAISLIVGGIGIMNTMYTAVLERTREIGVMKAVGARNADVLKIFLIESGFIGLVGGFFGVVLGLLIAKGVEIIAALADFSLLRIAINYKLVLFALAFAFIVGMLSGALPARQAAKLKPVDALRYE